MSGLTDVLTGALPSVGGAIGTLIQNAGQKKQQQREFENNKEMWNASNYYNSPEQQMQRLKDAGLNPNLVYGNGSVVGNSSSPAPRYNAPNLQRLPLEMFNPLDMISKYMDIKQKSAQTDLTNEAIIKQQIENRYLAPMTSARLGKQIGETSQLHQYLGIDDKNWSFNKDGTWKVNHVPVENSAYKQHILNGLDLQTTTLRKYNAETDSTNMRTKLMEFEKEFMETIPKSFQWLAPFIFKLVTR